MFKLTKRECLYVATKFNDEARARLIIRWEELETERNKDIAYFERKEQLYNKKYQCETKIRSLRFELAETSKGKELKQKINELKNIKKQIAGMDRKQFGHTYNLFSMLEKNN